MSKFLYFSITFMASDLKKSFQALQDSQNKIKFRNNFMSFYLLALLHMSQTLGRLR